ncbi:MAG: hypothetical protein ACRDMA_14870, partial [Solirubrobacterales bacterium]
YLGRVQRRDGGWALAESGPTNTQSTAWAVQGLLAAGRDPAAVSRGGRDPFEYLAARQSGDGHYTYSASSDQTPVWVTSQALLAVYRKTFPLAAVARAPGGGGAEAADGAEAAAGEEGKQRAEKAKPGKKEASRSADSAVAGEQSSGGGGENPAAPTFEQTSSDDGGPSTRQVVVGGLGLLALALGGGFFLYRRRLPG